MGGSRYKAEFADQARKLCVLGATNPDLADFFGVSKTSVDNWIAGKPAFREAVLDGRQRADARVAESLFQRAVGYSHPDTHITSYRSEITETPITKHYPPDTIACTFWLKNRRPDLWRDRHEQEVTGKGGGPVEAKVTITLD